MFTSCYTVQSVHRSEPIVIKGSEKLIGESFSYELLQKPSREDKKFHLAFKTVSKFKAKAIVHISKELKPNYGVPMLIGAIAVDAITDHKATKKNKKDNLLGSTKADNIALAGGALLVVGSAIAENSSSPTKVRHSTEEKNHYYVQKGLLSENHTVYISAKGRKIAYKADHNGIVSFDPIKAFGSIHPTANEEFYFNIEIKGQKGTQALAQPLQWTYQSFRNLMGVK